VTRYALVQLQIEFSPLECRQQQQQRCLENVVGPGRNEKEKPKGNSSACFSFSRRVQMQIIWWLL